MMYQPLKETKKTVLLDTDIGPDCDDVGAIAVLAHLAKRYDVPVAAIINCASNSYGTSCAEILASYCGLTVPVFGENKEAGLLDDAICHRYNQPITEQFGAPKSYVGAVEAYRKALATLPAKGAVIVTIGPLTTFAQLMNSRADEYSPLDGISLIEEKVYAVVSMAAKYPEGREFNLFCDVAAAKRFFDDCPVPIYLSDFDIGIGMMSGFAPTEHPPTTNPIYTAYCLHSGNGVPGQAAWNNSFDLTAVHFAFEGDSDFFAVSDPEQVVMEEVDSNRFIPDANGKCRRMILRKSKEALGAYYTEILASY